MARILAGILIFVGTYVGLNYTIFKQRQSIEIPPINTVDIKETLKEDDINISARTMEEEIKPIVQETIDIKKDDIKDIKKDEIVYIKDETKKIENDIKDEKKESTIIKRLLNKTKTMTRRQKKEIENNIKNTEETIKHSRSEIKSIKKEIRRYEKKEYNIWGRAAKWQSIGLGELYINSKGFHESSNERG